MDGDEELSVAALELKIQQAQLDREWVEQGQLVIELEAKEKEGVKVIGERQQVVKRIRLCAAGQVAEVEALARKESKVPVGRPAKKFSPCGPACILTRFDTKITFKVCVACGEKKHELCQLEAEMAEVDDEVTFQVRFTCRNCLESADYELLKEQVEKEMEALEVANRGVAKELAAARMELSAKKGEALQYQGKHRRQLEEIMANDIGVHKCEYPSGAFVGNHCDKIVDNYEKLAVVLDDAPEVKEGFLEFGAIYKTIHFLMKAKRELTDDEIALLEVKCHQLGEVFPRVFGGSITPKLHELIFYVPVFAKKWRTVGGMREEGIESAHNVANQIERVLVCMRNEEERLAKILERVEVKKVQKAGELAELVPRNFSVPRELKKKRH